MDSLLSHRVPFSAIVDRAPLPIPKGGRMLVWIIVNVEHWSMAKAMPRTVLSPPMGQALKPDLPNWAWHEYGMRVGFWRLRDALQRRNIVPTMAVNGIVCETYPRIAEAALELGWEFMGHGHVQGPMHSLEDQAASIEQAVQSICQFTGKAPTGWESPGLTENDQTIDLLSAAGIEYVADWVLDDQPTWIQAKPKPVLSVPYTVEINDIPMMLLQSHASDELFLRGREHLDRLWMESVFQTRVMAISVHPYITGTPHRIGYFEQLLDYLLAKEGVVIQTGEEISQWYRHLVPPP